MQRWFPDPEVVKYLNAGAVPWPYPDDGALTYLQALTGLNWAITLEGELIGAIGVSQAGQDHRGFWLGRPWWGQGYMTEAAEAVTDHVMGVLRWPQLRTGNAVGNVASHRLKKGFRQVGTETRRYVSGVHEHEIWILTQDDYRRLKNSF